MALVLVPVCWNYLMGHAAVILGWRTVVNDREVGLAELRLPPGWTRTSISRVTAAIEASDRLRPRFVIVVSEPRPDPPARMTLAEFQDSSFQKLVATKIILECDGPRSCVINECEALQTEVLMVGSRTPIRRYLHTAIAGQRAFHEVIAWVDNPREYDRATFEQIPEGFRERPGPLPESRPG